MLHLNIDQVDDTALHFVIVAARDMGTPSRTGTTTVAVVIHDVNDSPPTFEREAYYQFISESAPIGTVVETVKATDPDTVANTKMRYRFAGNDPMRKCTLSPIQFRQKHLILMNQASAAERFRKPT